MARKGEAGIIGKGNIRQTFICVDDVAEFHVRALDLPEARNRIFDLGGPEALSARDVVAVYEEICGKRLKIRSTPAFGFNPMRHLLGPLNPAAANILALNYAGTQVESVMGTATTAALFGVNITSARNFLKSKVASTAESVS
jgi:nucleoside-diphosphate-sugar epimerase